MKERVFNYNHHAHHHLHDLPSTHENNPSQLSNTTARRLIGGRRHLQEKHPLSLNDEFNMKLVEKGTTSAGVQAQDLPPEAALYIQSAGMNRLAHRPTSAKKGGLNISSDRLNTARVSSTNQRLSTAAGSLPTNGGSMTARSHLPEGPFYNASSSYIWVKTPRDRMLTSRGSVALNSTENKEKLPPPPLGRTMGHGLLLKH